MNEPKHSKTEYPQQLPKTPPLNSESPIPHPYYAVKPFTHKDPPYSPESIPFWGHPAYPSRPSPPPPGYLLRTEKGSTIPLWIQQFPPSHSRTELEAMFASFTPYTPGGRVTHHSFISEKKLKDIISLLLETSYEHATIELMIEMFDKQTKNDIITFEGYIQRTHEGFRSFDSSHHEGLTHSEAESAFLSQIPGISVLGASLLPSLIQLVDYNQSGRIDWNTFLHISLMLGILLSMGEHNRLPSEFLHPSEATYSIGEHSDPEGSLTGTEALLAHFFHLKI